MAYGSLFERLSGQVRHRQGWNLENAANASVASHLTRMLGSRRGSVQALPDYGLPDINDMRLSQYDVLVETARAIGQFIETYEPRLSAVFVVPRSCAPGSLRLSFSIEGMLEVGNLKHRVRFLAALDERCEVTVSTDEG
ncbi:type VI secretion system baseplate subunit TssE [Pseudomonas gingeri]|jgi:type VI secretion system protein|uniref:Type VI secretion system baseplate subunit TssE n=1 Tax=Pseudomonas gingeri TaxID=117681 RepID=A0A7Y7WBX8_9PSED|nr:type VI secretion system baseplate subunit TssE [Pseudomonas gingeri]NWB46549.1 type VI secretion system baseplate subunit TssE [Pseudomonas gingeri]